jgi:hypothetical protein
MVLSVEPLGNGTGVSGWMVRPPDVPDGQNCLGNLFRFGTLSLGYLFRCQAIWADLLLHLHFILRKLVEPDGCVDSFWEINHPVLGLYIAINYKFKFKFFINKESTIRNMHIWKNARMTPSGTIVVLLLFFIFLVFPCFILLFVLVICAFFHICMSLWSFLY